jgi:hypothetical protein
VETETPAPPRLSGTALIVEDNLITPWLPR